MKYERKQLYEINIHDLRILARKIGVKAPTKLKKKELIDEILKIESGKKQPCAPSNRGRPLKKCVENRAIEKEEPLVESNPMDAIKEIKKEFINSLLKQIEKKLNELL